MSGVLLGEILLLALNFGCGVFCGATYFAWAMRRRLYIHELRRGTRSDAAKALVAERMGAQLSPHDHEEARKEGM